ncbi:MAG TPA: alpha/beta fold hydrolase [Phototrophicaceae bacterium]|jgi:pimeloyl-ACP methyl ester carboxylesterase/DNA-binding CsgD family transcriptional regulator|nr:alpha/beta fold hydrolase [Phototrophicaceae bacterium]
MKESVVYILLYKVTIWDGIMEGKEVLPDQLTEREKEILDRLSTGLTDQQIADELFLSLNTVKWHNRQIYSKLRVSNRAQAILGAKNLERSMSMVEQRIRFCSSLDGARIAYATTGAGPPLVRAANWLTHLEFDLHSPIWRHWITELSRYHTFVRYDERGCGLSDWDVNDFSLDAWVHDLEIVVDTLGLERFPLLGLSQGAAVAIEYAVRHPERVSCLILYGSLSCGLLKGRLTPKKLELAETLIKVMELGWGQDNPAFRQVFTAMFVPDGTSEQMRWFDNLQRASTSPANAIKFEQTFHLLDVTDVAARVNVPTLVLHARHDGLIPFRKGRELAALIPGAQFVPLEGKNHILMEDEPAWSKFVTAMRSFLNDNG